MGVRHAQVQIIKGWVDGDGQTHEKVSDIAGDANNGATVDPQTCGRVGRGMQQPCTAWQDPEFEADKDSFYYVRVLENPSCRWSTMQCQAFGVNPFANDCAAQAEAATERAHENGASGDVFGKCCIDPANESFYSPTIQERAWSSPIWYKSANGI